MPGRRVEFNPFAVCDRGLQDLGDNILHFAEGIYAVLIVTDDEIQVGQDAVVLELPDHLEDLLIVPLVVLLLGPSPLEILGPELLVVHLMHGKKGKIQLSAIPVPQLLILWDRDGLHAEFQSLSDADPVSVYLFHAADLVKIRRIIDVGQRIFRVCIAYTVAVAPFYVAFFPVLFDPVVDVIGKADLLKTKFNGLFNLFFHRLSGVVRKFCVNVIVCVHASRYSSCSLLMLSIYAVHLCCPLMLSRFRFPQEP